MSLIKKRIYITVAVLLMAWPLCQHFLVRTYGVNPWRFFGWAMYAMPAPTLRIDTWFTDVPQSPPFQTHPEYQQALKAFSERRAHWGGLEQPQELADILFKLEPKGHELHIRVATVTLGTSTSMLVEKTQTYRFERMSD
jgi:hypothetical protein